MEHGDLADVRFAEVRADPVDEDLLAGGRVGLERVQAEVVDHAGEREVLRNQVGPVRDQLVDGVLEREHGQGRLTGGEPVPGAGPGQLGQARPQLAGRVLVRAGHDAQEERVQVLKLGPDLHGRTAAADPGRHELAPAADDLILMVAHVGRHPPLAGVIFH